MTKLPGGLKHAFWSLADTAIYPVLYMATVPILLHYMGEASFGFWIVLNTMIIILQLFNFNLGFTALRHIAHERVNGNTSLINRIINSLLRITILQWAGVVFLGLCIAVFMGIWGWPGRYSSTIQYGAICFLLASVMAGFKYFEQLLQNILKAYELFRSAALLNMVSRFGSLLVTVVLAVIYHSGMLYILIGNVIFGLLYLLLHYFILHKSLPFYTIKERGNSDQRKELLRYSMWPWVQSLIVVLTFQADRFWISGYAGLKEVAAYGLVATMFNHIHMIFMAMVAWILPRIISLHANGSDTKGLYTFTRSMLTGITIASLLTFYVLSPWLFKLWVGVDTYLQMKGYIQAFTGFELIYIHTIMPLFYLNGTGKEKQATYTTLLYCVLCYALMLGGLWLFSSPIFFVYGMTVGICITMPVFNMLVQRAMGKNISIAETLGELLPVYAAIGLIYLHNTWAIAGITIVAAALLWKYYLANIFNKKTWSQVFNA